MTKEQLLSNMTSLQAVFMMYNSAVIKVMRINTNDIDGFEKTYNGAGKRLEEMLAFDQIKHPMTTSAELSCMVEAFSNLAGRNIVKAAADSAEPIPEKLQRMIVFTKDICEFIFCGYMNGDDMNEYTNGDLEQDLPNDVATALVQEKLRDILVIMGRTMK
jgi:hypothetical protein